MSHEGKVQSPNSLPIIKMSIVKIDIFVSEATLQHLL